MFRLLEISLINGKESVAIYPTEEQTEYKDKTELIADFEIKYGQAMKEDSVIQAECLVAFDGEGKVYAQAFTSKDITTADSEGNSIESKAKLSPRLIWVFTNAEGKEIVDQKKTSSIVNLEAESYIKRGNAKKDSEIVKYLILGISGENVYLNNYWSRYESDYDSNTNTYIQAQIDALTAQVQTQETAIADLGDTVNSVSETNETQDNAINDLADAVNELSNTEV